MAWLNWPNRITIARIMLIVPLVICLLNLNAGWSGARHVALALLVVMGASDVLDGFLARKMGEETALGRFLDPLADKLLIACSVILLSIERTSVEGFVLPSWVPVIVVGKDVLLLLGSVLVHISVGEFVIEPRFWGKACMLLQSAMVGAVLLAPDLPVWLQRLMPASWWLAGAVAVIAAMDYLRAGNRFAAKKHAESQKGNFNE